MTSENSDIDMEDVNDPESGSPNLAKKTERVRSQSDDTSGKQVSGTGSVAGTPSRKRCISNEPLTDDRRVKRMKEKSESSLTSGETGKGESSRNEGNYPPPMNPPESPPQGHSSASVSTGCRASGMFAKAGDKMTFGADVTRETARSRQPLLLKLENSRRPRTRRTIDEDDVYQLCVDVQIKAKLIEKAHVCKVCGFSVPDRKADTEANPPIQSGREEIMAHILTHSLEEVRSSGCSSPEDEKCESEKPASNE